MAMQDTAIANADLRYGTSMSEVRRAIESLLGQTKANVTALEGYGQKGPEAINTAYNILDTKLGENRAESSRKLGEQVNLVGQGYRDAQNIAEVGRNQSRADMAALAERMGNSAIAQHLPVAQTGIEEAINRVLSTNANQDATATGNLRTFAAENDAILGRGQNIGTQMRADAQSRFQTELLDSLANARLEGVKGQNELTGNLLDLSTERGAFLASEMARLAEEQWQRDYAQAQLDQQAQISNAELAARAADRSASRSSSDRSDALGWAQLEAGKQSDKDRLALDWAKLNQEDPANAPTTDEQWRVANALLQARQADPTGAYGFYDQTVSTLMDQGLLPRPKPQPAWRPGGIATSGVRGILNVPPKPPKKEKSWWEGVKDNMLLP
jgi:hypothetical protein